MKTYAQALKTPKRGWKHADEESMCAVLAESIALHTAMNPKVVYNWIRKHYGTDHRRVRNLTKSAMPFLDIVGFILEDIPVDEEA